MVADDLVRVRVIDGRKFIGRLVDSGFDVTSAAWVKGSEDGPWFLYISSKDVDNLRLAEAYRRAYAALAQIEGTTISASDVKLIGTDNAITRDILRFRTLPRDKYRGPHLPRIGDLSIEAIYVYRFAESYRMPFSVKYLRSEKPNAWRTAVIPGEVFEGNEPIGAVGYTTAGREGESPGDCDLAVVSVVLEVDPQFSEGNFPRALLNRLAEDALQVANQRFKKHHPEAEILHGEGVGA